jgi:hypothetical protein
VQISENSDELYEELANKIEARDDPAARRAFQELLKTGRSRQEIVIQVSRVIEKRNAGNPGVSGTRETSWLKPHRSFGASQVEGLKKPSAWSDTPTTYGTDQHAFGIGVEKASLGIARTDTDPAQRADVPSQLSPKPQTIAASADPEKPISEHKTADVREPAIERFEERSDPFFRDISPRPVGPSTEHSALSVPERVASKLRLQTNVPAAEVKLTAPTEALAVTDPPRPAQQGSRASSRGVWPILAVISVIAAAAGLFVLSTWFGGDLEELASASAHRTLTWLEGVRGANVSSSAGPAKPMEKTGQPEQSTAGRQNNEMPKSPLMAAGDNKSAETQTEPSSKATSTLATAGYSEKTPSPIEAPGSQVEETPGSQIPQGANSPTPVFSQQNEPEVAQQPQTAGPQLPSVDTAALVAQGDQFLSKSDVASARELYQRATEAGDGRGALRMGMTFDPVFLARWRLRGVRGDRAQAITWYRRASALGNAEAELMQNSMSRGTGSASRSVAAGQPSQDPGIAAPHGQRNSHGAAHRARAPRDAKRG